MVSPTLSEPRRRVSVLGVSVDCLTMDECVQRIEGFLQEDGPKMVVTADASALVMVQEDPELGRIVRESALVTPDGAGVVWALRRAGCGDAQRVSGADLVLRLCQVSADKGTRLFFLGAEPGVAEKAAERLRLRVPGCNIVGTRHGYFPADSDDLVAAEVAEARPDVVLVAMGMPRQEKFIAKTMGVLGAKVLMGVGGSFDVYSGKTKRAPILVQRLRLEWLWRLVLNPRKFDKVRRLPKFVAMVLRSPR